MTATSSTRPQLAVLYLAIPACAAMLSAALFNEMLLIMVGCLALVLAALPFSRWLALVFFASTLVFRVAMSFSPIVLAGYRFYAADLVAYFFCGVIVYSLWCVLNRNEPPLFSGKKEERLLLFVFALSIFWGIVALGYGMFITHQPARNVLGDFRRIYFYSIGFCVPLGLGLNRTHLSKLKYAILAGGLGSVMFGIYRMATGNLYRATTLYTQYPRLLADDETLSLAIMLAYAVAVMSTDTVIVRRIMALGLAAVSITFLVISGWRMGLALAVLSPSFAQLCLAIVRGDRIGGLIKRGMVLVLILVVLAALAAVAIVTLLPDSATHVLVMTKQRHQDLATPFVGDLRFYVYKQAIIEYISHPIMGTGLGHEMEYFALTSNGLFLLGHGSTHNVFLDVLYQTGTLGLLMFAAFHAFFCRYFLRRLRQVPPEFLTIAVALFTGYVCTLIHYCFEPTNIAGSVAMYLMMGFLLCCARIPASETPCREDA